MMGSNDEQILRVFRKAADKGVNSVSTDMLLISTDMTRQTLNMRLNNLTKYGIVLPVEDHPKTRQWRFNP